MKLISMQDFVIQEWEKDLYTDDFAKIVKSYADFLKKTLKLEMFVPCDEDGKVLEEPKGYKYWIKDDENGAYNGDDESKCRQYQKTKEKVLFEDFEIATNKKGEKLILGDYTCLKVSDLENGTIEDLVKYVHIKLTKSAVKCIFG